MGQGLLPPVDAIIKIKGKNAVGVGKKKEIEILPGDVLPGWKVLTALLMDPADLRRAAPGPGLRPLAAIFAALSSHWGFSLGAARVPDDCQDFTSD